MMHCPHCVFPSSVMTIQRHANIKPSEERWILRRMRLTMCQSRPIRKVAAFLDTNSNPSRRITKHQTWVELLT